MVNFKVFGFCLTLIGLICLGSCTKKDKEFTMAEGQVTDAHTGKPVPFATIQVRSHDATICFMCFNVINIGDLEFEKQANSEGRFSFGFDAKEKRNYNLFANSATHYFNDSDHILLQNSKNNKALNLKLNPYAWIKILVKNDPPAETAYITVDGLFEEGYIELTDFSSDTTIFRKTTAFNKSQIRWTINRIDGSYIQRQDSVQAIPSDTTFYEIRY